jgi:hypothetical protein
MWKIFSVPCGSALYKFYCITLQFDTRLTKTYAFLGTRPLINLFECQDLNPDFCNRDGWNVCEKVN